MGNRKQTSLLTSEDLKIMKRIRERQSKTSLQRQPKTCTIKGCTKKFYAKGWYFYHYRLLHDSLRKCSVDGCNLSHHADGFCKKHYDNERLRTKRKTDPEWRAKTNKRAMELYYKSHDKKKLQKRERLSRMTLKAIRILGGKCDSCGEKHNPNLKKSNLEFHHHSYNEKELERKKKLLVIANTAESIIKMSKRSNPKKKFALLCKQCHDIETFSHQDPKKAFDMFAWMYDDGMFDEVLNDDAENNRKITEFLNS